MITRDTRLPTSITVLNDMLATETDPARRQLILQRIEGRQRQRAERRRETQHLKRQAATFANTVRGISSITRLEAMLADATPRQAEVIDARIASRRHHREMVRSQKPGDR